MKLSVIQQDQILYLECHFWLFHRSSYFKILQNDLEFKEFKQECSQTGTTEESIAKLKNWF